MPVLDGVEATRRLSHVCIGQAMTASATDQVTAGRKGTVSRTHRAITARVRAASAYSGPGV